MFVYINYKLYAYLQSCIGFLFGILPSDMSMSPRKCSSSVFSSVSLTICNSLCTCYFSSHPTTRLLTVLLLSVLHFSAPPCLIASFNVSYSLFIYNLFNDVAKLRFVNWCCLCMKTLLPLCTDVRKRSLEFCD